MLTFTVPGEPRGKGRPRFSRNGTVYTDSKTRAYENKIVDCYRDANGAMRAADPAFVAVDVVAYLPIPRRSTKAQVAGMIGKEILPSKKPDVDNILKIVLDALNGIAYKDDSRVYRASCVKYYASDPHLEITIEETGRY